MNVLLFGLTGMIGQGVFRECSLDPDVKSVLAVGRSASGQRHEKLREVVLPNVTDLSSIEHDLGTINACFYCLGVTAAGLTEQEYSRATFDLTTSVANTLVRVNPAMTFCYISGAGADSSEQGRIMWARVKGRTENALLRLPFRASYMFRPGLIQPLHGIRSRTGWYNAFYAASRPFYPALVRLAPQVMTTTEQLGRAMLHVAKTGFDSRIIGTRDINRL